MTTVRKHSALIATGNLVQAGGSRNIVTVGVRPVWWVSDNIALQGVASAAYIDNVRSQSGNGQATVHSGEVEKRLFSHLHPRSSQKAGTSRGLKYGCSQRMRSGVIL